MLTLRDEMPRKEREDLTGQVFGRLTVLRATKDRRYWVCKCSCGNLKRIRSDALTEKTAQSCGCFKTEAVAKIRANWDKYCEIDATRTPIQRRLSRIQCAKKYF